MKQTLVFDENVPQPLRDKLLEVATEAKGGLDFGYKSTGCMGDTDMQPIYGVPYAGYFPWQDGGYELSTFYRSDEDASYHFCPEQTEDMTKQGRACWAEFCRQTGLEESVDYDDLTEEHKQLLPDFENSWFEPASLAIRFYTKLDPSGLRVVLVTLDLNWRDGPYYRQQFEHTLYNREYTEQEFMQASTKDILSSIEKYQEQEA